MVWILACLRDNYKVSMKFPVFTACCSMLLFSGILQTSAQSQTNQHQTGINSLPASKNSASGTDQPAQPASQGKTNVKVQAPADFKTAQPSADKSIPVIAVRSALDRSKEYTLALKQVLSLTDDQSLKMVDINTQLIQQIDKLAKSSKTSSEYHDGLQLADRARVEGYSKILSEKQLKVYSNTPQLSGLTHTAVVPAEMVKPAEVKSPDTKPDATKPGADKQGADKAGVDKAGSPQ